MRAKVRSSLFKPGKRWGKRITGIVITMVFLLTNVLPFGMMPFIFSAQDAYAAVQIPLAVKYDDFSDITGIQLVKKALVNGGVLTVSPNDGGPALGAAFTSEKIKLEDENSFSTYFAFNFDNRSGGGAEGMVFLLQSTANNVEGITTNKFGTGGIKNSFAIEFDTFQNSTLASPTIEPAENHVAVFSDGDPYGNNIATSVAPAGLNFDDAAIYHVWIGYDGLNDELRVYMGTTDAVSEAQEVLTASLDLVSILGTDEVFAGFSAGSGDYRQDHNIHKWYMRNYCGDLSGEYKEVTSLTSDISVISSTKSEITYTLKDHLNQNIDGVTIYFETSDGVLSATQGQTDANGQVSVSLESDSAINANLTAIANGGRINRTEVAIEGNQLSEQECVDTDWAAITLESLLGDNTDAANITGNLSLPTAGANGTTISWSSNNTDYISNTGVVTQPAAELGDQPVSLTATVSKGTAAPKTKEAFAFTVKAAVNSDQECVDTDCAAITLESLLGDNPDALNITGNLSLPSAGANGTTISWSSTNTDYITDTGVVTRPASELGDQSVSLTATVSKGTADPKTTAAFAFTVKAAANNDQECVDTDWAAITLESLLGENADVANITGNLSLPTAGASGTTISWSSNNTDYISNTGVVTQPAAELGDQAVTLTATVSKGTATPKTTEAFAFTVKAAVNSDQENVDADFAAITLASLLGENTGAQNITTNLSLPAVGTNGSTISWTSSDVEFISNTGVVTRPTYTSGDKSVTLTATVSKGTAAPRTTAAFAFVVKAVAINDQESVDNAAEALNYASFIGKNASPFSLASNLDLPSDGANGTDITWSSSDETYVTDDGIVEQPEYGEGFQSVQLTATITRGAASTNKTFPLAVKPLEDTTAPSIISSTPGDGATMLNNNGITITCSETIKLTDANKIKVTVIDENGTQIDANSVRTIDDNTLEIQPVYEMTDADEIKLLIMNDGITDLSGNPLENDFELNYTFITTRPVLLSSSVENMQKNVPVNKNLVLQFADPIVIDEEQIKLQKIERFLGRENPEEVDILVNTEADKLTIRALNELLPEEEYRLFIPNEAIADSAGNGMKTPIEIEFSTAAISEINLVSPLSATDTYIFGDYIRLEFDQLFNVKIDDESWKKDDRWWLYSSSYNQEEAKNYFTFGKSLFIKKDNLNKTYMDECYGYRVKGLEISSKYNGGCKASLASGSAIEDNSIRRSFRGRKFCTLIHDIAAADVNVGSSPETPANFGEQIETAYVTLDYKQAITAQALNLIKVENPYGIALNIRAEIDGSRLIVRPASGEWIPSQDYILKVPQGALKTAGGDALKRFEYPFKTPIKYDYSDTSIDIGESKMAVGGYGFIYGNVRNDRPNSYSPYNQEKDYTRQITVKNITTGEIKPFIYHSGVFSNAGNVLCDTPGIYEVVLKIVDNGYEWQFRDSFEVVEIDKSLTKLTASKTGTETVYNYTQFEDSYHTFARLSNNDMFLGNKQVKIELIGAKTGNKYYSAVDTTNGGGYASFDISVDDLPNGKLKVVFSSPETDEKAMYYLSPKKIRGSSDLNIYLRDSKTKKTIKNVQDLRVTIDGDPLSANKVKDGIYSVEDVRPGEHDLRVQIRYYNDKVISEKLKNGDNKIVYYLDRFVPSSKIRMGETTSDYTYNNYKDSIFIDGVDANITFKNSPNWHGHEPGQIIYEFYKGNKSRQFPTEDGKLTVNVGKLLGPGTRGRVYAVSKDGSRSNKQDIKMEVAPKPSYCHASFSESKKKYFLNYNFSLDNAGSAKVPRDWPLIGGEQFTIDVGTFQLGGVMDPHGKIDFTIGLSELDFENAAVMSNYKDLVKDFKAGKFGDDDSDLGFSFDTNQVWNYDTSKNAWSYVHGDYTLYLEGEASYTQYFVVVVVPAYLKGVLGVEADAKLNADVIINKNNKIEGFKYSGQIDAAPSIEIAVGAGVDGLNAEGFLGGKIEASMPIPEFTFAADGKITGGVRATALLWSWEKNAIEYSWNIAAPKRTIAARSMMLAGDSILLSDVPDYAMLPASFLAVQSDELISSEEIKQSDFEMLTRDKDDSDIWIGSRPALRALAVPEKVSRSILMQDVPDFTNTALTAIGEDLFLVWAEDNPARTASNRTELKYAAYDGSSWTDSSYFDQDATADFNPVVTSTSGAVIIVWQDMKRILAEDEGFADYLAAGEISAAELSHGTLCGKTTLTDDGYYDYMPAIAYSDGKTHLVWVKNKSNNILSPAAGSFEILYAVNDGSGWSTPMVLETGLNQIADLDIAADGSEVTIAYNLDEDGDIFTSEDWEVYAKQAVDGTWSSTVKLTDDGIQDSNIRAMYENDEATVIWLRKGMLSEMNIEEQEIAAVHDISAQAFELAQSESDIEALSYITGIEDGVQNIKTIFYDRNVGEWSKPVEITANDCVNSEIAAAITSNNEMTVINKAKEKIVEQIDGEEYANLGAANIEAHKIILTTDLKAVENTINFTGGFITDGDNQINVTIENCGEFTVNNYEVVFYDGLINPIAHALVSTPLFPGEQTIVSASWIAPETVESPDITVTVDPDDTIGDIDRSNNTVTEAVLKSDVSIKSYRTYPIADNNYLLEMELANYSSLMAEDVEVNFYHNDMLINTQTIPMIDCGLTEDVVMELDTGDLFGPSNTCEGLIDIDVKGTFADAEDINDRLTIEFNRLNIQVNSSNIDDGAAGVPTDTSIELELSDNVNQGTDYNNIKLTDFSGNTVPVSKEIADSRFLIKPADILSQGTYYSLTVPEQSLVTDYDQNLASDYNLAFITDTSDLSVTGSYPADDAVDIAVADDISVQYNKTILEGPEFEQIVLIQDGENLVSTDISIADNMIVIDPVYALRNNTVYSIYIPPFAVMDAEGNFSESKYEFCFATVDGPSGGSSGGDNERKPAKADPVLLPEYTISLENVNDSETGFVAQLTGETNIFGINQEVISQMQTQNKALMIKRDDITLTIQELSDAAPFTVSMSSQPASGGGTHENDRVLSCLYTVSLQSTDGNIDLLNNQLLVSIPVDTAQINDPEKCAVFYQDENGNWQPAGGVIDVTTQTMQFRLTAGRPFMVVERDIRFQDTQNRWSEEAIAVLAAKGIISGKSQTEFDPLGDITRAEFATLIVRSLFEGNTEYENAFFDITADEWYADYIAKAVELGLVSGFGNGQFAPNERITREQMIVILDRLYQLKAGESDNNLGENGEESSNPEIPFKDFASASDYSREAIIRMEKMSIVNGSDGNIMPRDFASREQAAMMIYKLMKKMGTIIK